MLSIEKVTSPKLALELLMKPFSLLFRSPTQKEQQVSSYLHTYRRDPAITVHVKHFTPVGTSYEPLSTGTASPQA